MCRVLTKTDMFFLSYADQKKTQFKTVNSFLLLYIKLRFNFCAHIFQPFPGTFADILRWYWNLKAFWKWKLVCLLCRGSLQSSIFMEQSIVFFMHSFIHCISVWVGSTWFDPLSRLGGVLWGRLLPPSLPSPLPCPGRGTRDLKGLSTEAPPPRSRGSHHGMVETVPPLDPRVFPLSLPVWPACMHAPQCLCLSSALRTTSCPLTAWNKGCCGSLQHQRWWWCVVLQNALWMIRRLRANPVKWRWNASSPVCLLLLALKSKAHPFT